MPSVSKIHRDIHKYATKCAYEIRNREVEFAKGLRLNSNLDKILAESALVKGTKYEVDYNVIDSPKDILTHNHPDIPNTCTELSLQDITLATYRDIKKIYAATKDGYTSMDMTTVKKSLSKDKMLEWIFAKAKILTIEKLRRNNYGQKHYQTIRDFAKYTGATFSEVKWSDYDKVKTKGLQNGKRK